MKVSTFILLLVFSVGCVSGDTEAPAIELLPSLDAAQFPVDEVEVPTVELLPGIIEVPYFESPAELGAGPAIEVVPALNDNNQFEYPVAEAAVPDVVFLLVNVPPPSPPLSPPTFPSPPPAPLLAGGCPGLAMAFRFDNYTIDTFGPAESEAFCNDIKTATSWPYTICATTSVLNYPSPLASVIVSAYVIFEVANTSNLTVDTITAGYYRDLLLSNLNQTTLLPVIFSNLNTTVETANECPVYSGISPGYVCSKIAADCSLKGCFVDSDGNEYASYLFADSFTCSARDVPPPAPFLPPLAPGGGRNENSTSPSPPPPSPPVTPSVCTYIGTYRLQSVACPEKYIAVFPSCTDKDVVLRSSSQAPGVRIRWNLNTTTVDKNGVPAPIKSLRSCPDSSLHLTSPSGARQPSLGGSSWRFQVVPSGGASCGNVNIIANSRLSNGPFLGVSSTCDSFVWSAAANSTSAEFKAIRV